MNGLELINSKLDQILALLTPPKADKGYSEMFEYAWAEYPRKVGKKAASKAYQASTKKASHHELLRAVKNYAKTCSLEGTESRFICHMATFLGPKETWRDYVEKPLSDRSKTLPTASTQTGIKTPKKPETDTAPKFVLFDSDEHLTKEQIRGLSDKQLAARWGMWMRIMGDEGDEVMGTPDALRMELAHLMTCMDVRKVEYRVSGLPHVVRRLPAYIILLNIKETWGGFYER